MNQYEKIKQMDKSELGAFLCNLMCADCCNNRCPASEYCKTGRTGMKAWLESEADNEQRED